MINYVLLTEIKTETTKDEWWMDLTNNSETLRIFNSFDKAKSEMRKAVTQIIKKCDFFPLKNGQYEPIEEYYEDIAEFGSEEIKKLGDIICNTINKYEEIISFIK